MASTSRSSSSNIHSTPLPPPSTGAGATYTPSLALSSKKAPQPRTSAVAHFSSLPNDGIGNDSLLTRKNGNNSNDSTTSPLPTAGRLLAINSHYIAYAVKKGLVRVIDRRTAAKTLLRGHGENTRIVDASFFGGEGGASQDKVGVASVWKELAESHWRRRRELEGGDSRVGGGANADAFPSGGNGPAVTPDASDILATVGGKGDGACVLIWRIHGGGNHVGQAKAAETMGAEKLLELRFSLAARILWHPFNPNRFLLLHRNGGSAGAADGNQGNNGKRRRYRSVATLVDTTRLVTYPHATEGHTVCDCVPSTAAEDDGNARSDEEWTFPGASQFYVTLDQGQGDQPLAGANDVAWSSKDAKHVLTAHDDGKVRLWDASLPVSMVRTEAGQLVRSGSSAMSHSVGGSHHHAVNSVVSSIPCVAELDVASAICDLNGHSDKRITRVMFLSRYESEVGQQGGVAITPPFVTGAEMNHTITLWSSFSSAPSSTSTNTTAASTTAIHPPKRLRTFRLHSDVTPPPLSSLLSVELCPAPYLPPVSTSDEIAVPSSFLLLAERHAGSMHALHFLTEWKADDHASAARTGAAPTAVTVKGFDYVATLNVVHPVFSYCVAPAAAGDATTTSSPPSLAEEIDVELCCVQSKAVQMLTLSGAMLCGGKGMGANYAKDLVEGVSVLEFSKGDDEDGKEEEAQREDDLMDEEEFEEEEYDLEDDEDARLENTRDGDDEENDSSPFLLPGLPPPESNAPPPPPTDDPFSNWLGAIAQTPLPPPTSAPPPSAPPPGLGFPSPPSFPNSSTLPPPPGMVGASAPPAPAAAASASGMTLLSPMEILSGGGAGSGSNPSLSSVHTTTTHHHAPKTAESATKEKDAPRSVSASAAPGKKSTRGNASPMGPPPSSTIKGVGANKSKKTGDTAGTKKTGGPAAPVAILKRDEHASSSSSVEQTSSKALSAKHAVPSPVTSSHSIGSVVDIAAIESAIETTLASHLKTHEASLLAAMHKAVSSEVESAVRASMKGVEKSTEKSVERALSLDGKWGKKLEKVAKGSAEIAAKEAVAGMEVSIVSSLNKVRYYTWSFLTNKRLLSTWS